VLDRTYLTGNYDFTLEWAADQPASDDPGQARSPSGPTLYSAIREQLGLRLNETNGSVERFVIERAERPSEN